MYTVCRRNSSRFGISRPNSDYETNLAVDASNRRGHEMSHHEHHRFVGHRLQRRDSDIYAQEGSKNRVSEPEAREPADVRKTLAVI